MDINKVQEKMEKEVKQKFLSVNHTPYWIMKSNESYFKIKEGKQQ